MPENTEQIDYIAALGTPVPRRRGWKHHFAAFCMWLRGWKPAGQLPEVDRYVAIAAPHTTLSDGFWMVAVSWWFGFKLSWLVKDSMLRFPMKTFLLWVGAVPVNRRAPQGLVGQLTEAFQREEGLILAIPPEGTRGKRTYWKTGFYHIAKGANVPVMLSFLDYERKVGGLGPLIELSDDMSADMDKVRRFYAHIPGKFPELFTYPLLADEDLTENEARDRVGHPAVIGGDQRPEPHTAELRRSTG